MTVENMENAQVFDTGNKGRGLKAAKEMNPGDVVFAEPSYSAVVFNSVFTQVCHSCFRHQANLHRCAQCKFAHYCDRTCQTACWDEHKQECGALRKTGTPPNERVRLAARVLWRIHKDTGVASDSQLTSVDELEGRVSDLPEDQLKTLKADVDAFMGFWSYGRKQHSVEYISHLFGIIKCNSFTMTDQRGLQAVGVGLFPNLCLVNHDCGPNCSVTLNHGNQSALSSALHSQRRIELRAVKKVAEGEELTVSYVDFLDLSAERQKKLKELFHFDCTCETCSQRIKDDLMTAAVGGEGGKPSADKVKAVTAFSEESLKNISKARLDNDFHKVAQLCRECLGQQENVLADTHLLKLRVLGIASEVHSYLQRFAEAADFSRRMVDGYKQLYPRCNAQLGLAMMKAGVTQWHAGQVEAGHGLVCKAYRILMVTHGPNHSVTRDLESIRSQTESELKQLQKKMSS